MERMVKFVAALMLLLLDLGIPSVHYKRVKQVVYIFMGPLLS